MKQKIMLEEENLFRELIFCGVFLVKTNQNFVSQFFSCVDKSLEETNQNLKFVRELKNLRII